MPDRVRFSQISAGAHFSCGIRLDGGVTCWGDNDHQQLHAPEGTFTAVDAGWDHACALNADGAHCWGWAANERTSAPAGTLFIEIGAGAEHTCGLTYAGDLICWGNNADGRAESRDGPFQALAVGMYHTCVLQSDNIALCQGTNSAGQADAPIAEFSNISAGLEHTCGLSLSGIVTCWGGYAGEASNVVLGTPAGQYTAIGAGWKKTCAINSQGQAQCWNYTYSPIDIHPYEGLNFQNALPAHTFDYPTELLSWPLGGLAIADKHGLIAAYQDEQEPSVILDLRGIIDSAGSLNGLLSVAIDPNFRDNPYIYAYYTILTEQAEREAARLSRFPVVNGRASYEDGITIIEIPMQPRPNIGFDGSSHYGGSIRFGPDGMLYLAIGDNHCFRCPQELNNLHGKIIRLDVSEVADGKPYSVPRDNPFLDTPGARPEVWAYGMRNPWRMAFDSQSGKLWVSDVGHDHEEEITIALPGANLGWPVFEGSRCVEIDESMSFHYGSPTAYPCSDFEATEAPAATFGHTRGCAAVGGIVYRGTAISWLNGVYLFGDFCSGRVWALEDTSDAGWEMIQIADLPNSILSFGTDAKGEVYISTLQGPILRLVEAESGLSQSVNLLQVSTFSPRDSISK